MPLRLISCVLGVNGCFLMFYTVFGRFFVLTGTLKTSGTAP